MPLVSRQVLVLATLALAAPLRAQLATSVEAFAGYYRPFGHFDASSSYVPGVLPNEPSDLASPVLGAAGHVAFGHRIGFAGQFATTIKSRIPQFPTPGGLQGPTDATVVTGMLVGQYDVSPTPHAYHVWVNAGPGFVHHGGDAYRDYGSPTSLAAVVGTTLVVPVGWQLQLVAEASVLFYGLDLPTLEHGNQRDALLHIGLAWARH